MMGIDLRSDTVTPPTPAMRDAMAHAEVGDDVYGEDPTVNRLQERVAELTGMDAALFVPSGTMGNLVSVLAHCDRGREAILGDESHIFHYEAGGSSALGGVVLHAVPTDEDGRLPVEAIERAIRPVDVHFAAAAAVCLENTHNRRGGTVLPPAYFEEVAGLARRHQLAIHLDGARLFNAAIASNCAITEWTRHVTSVQLCLSKGLAAPVGSVVAGPRPFVDRARRIRKMVGGGMRQAGVVAAAGLVALDDMVPRLAEDHRQARAFATALAPLPGMCLDASRVQSNIVVFRLTPPLDAAEFLQRCRARGVLLTHMGAGLIRAVAHYDITESEYRHAAAVIAEVLKSLDAQELSRQDATFDALQGRR